MIEISGAQHILRRVDLWPTGAPVLWRSVHEDAVSTVVPMRVVSDDGRSRALYLSRSQHEASAGTRGGRADECWCAGMADTKITAAARLPQPLR
jgi:hypothetical protein